MLMWPNVTVWQTDIWWNLFGLPLSHSLHSLVRTERRLLTKSWNANSAFHLTSLKKPGSSWKGWVRQSFLLQHASLFVRSLLKHLERQKKWSLFIVFFQLLKRNASLRLGAGPGDAAEVQVSPSTETIVMLALQDPGHMTHSEVTSGFSLTRDDSSKHI